MVKKILAFLKKIFGYYSQFFLYLFIIFLFIIASNIIFFRIDLTKSQVFSLSKPSKKLVSDLVVPLRIKVFFSKNLPAPHNNTERNLKDLLEEYSLAGNKYFSYKFYDCSLGKEDSSEKIKKNIEVAGSYNIYPVQRQIIEKDEVKFTRVYMGIIIEHGDIVEQIADLSDTYALEYRFSQIIQRMHNKINALASLKEDIKIKLFLSSSLEKVGPHINIKNLSEVPKKMQEVIKACQKRNYGKVKYTFLDSSKDLNVKKKAESYKLQPLSWGDDKRINLKAGEGYASLVIEHGEKEEVISLIKIAQLPIFGVSYSLEKIEDLENRINSLIDNLLNINEKVAYLKDKRGLDISLPIRNFQRNTPPGPGGNFNQLVSKNYDISEITAYELTKNYKALIIAGVKEFFRERELFLIDQFLLSGRSLIIFQDAFEEVANKQLGAYGAPSYNPINTGLGKLLNHYGVVIEKGIVLDQICYEQLKDPQRGGGKQAVYFIPKVLHKQINTRFIALKGIKEIYANRTSPLSFNEEILKKNKIQKTVLFSSSPKSWVLKDRIILTPGYMVPPKEEYLKSFPLAALLEGEFTSYFSEIGPPEEISQENQGTTSLPLIKETFIKKGKKGKIFIMGTSGNIRNEILSPQGEFANSPILRGNAIFINNLVDYMNDRKNWALMRGKGDMRNPLVPYNVKSNIIARFFTNRDLIRIFGIYCLPILMIFVGFLFYSKRRKKKKVIKELFS